MEAHYWPTRSHIEGLRAQGQVPYSPAVTYCAATVGLILGMALAISQNGTKLVDSMQKVLRGGATPTEVSEYGHLAFSFIYFPLGACVVCAVLIGLLQTRFLFYFDKALPNLTRLAWKRHKLGKSVSKVFMASIIGVIVAASALWLLAPVLLSSFNLSPQSMKSVSAKVWWGSLITLGGAALCLMIIGWLVSWFQFMNSHRMTRQEYEAEAKE